MNILSLGSASTQSRRARALSLMQRSKSQSQPSAGDLSLHAPLLAADAACSEGHARGQDVTVACVAEGEPLPRNTLATACRLLPSLCWAACIFGLARYTQDRCNRPVFDFTTIAPRYNDGTIDALGTILNLMAGCSVLLAAAAAATAASCAVFSGISMCVNPAAPSPPPPT